MKDNDRYVTKIKNKKKTMTANRLSYVLNLTILHAVIRPRGCANVTEVAELFSGGPIVNVRRMPITLSASMNNELFLTAKSCSNVDLVRSKCCTAFSSWRNLPWRSAMVACKSWTSWINLNRKSKMQDDSLSKKNRCCKYTYA